MEVYINIYNIYMYAVVQQYLLYIGNIARMLLVNYIIPSVSYITFYCSLCVYLYTVQYTCYVLSKLFCK